MAIADYTWVPGADTGGGFANVCAVDSLNAGRCAVGGDTWGVCFSDNFGHNFTPCNKGTTGPYGRAVEFSQRPSNSGDIYWGTGGLHAGIAAGSLGLTRKNDNAYLTVDSTNGFGTGANYQGVGGSQVPRPLGKLIRTEYYSGSDTEYVYTASANGIFRYTNTNGIMSATRTTVWSNQNAYKATSLFDPATLFVGTYYLDANAASQTVQVYQITPAGGATTLHQAGSFNHTALSNVPSRVFDLETINGQLFAACGTGGLYVVTGASFSTWTAIDNGFLDDQATTVDGYATSGGGFVLFVGQGDPGTTLPLGHSIAKGVYTPGGAGGITNHANWAWTWQTVGGAVSYAERGSDALDPSGGRNWWLNPTNAGTYRVGLGQVAWDSSVLRVDPLNQNNILVCGRAGAWTSENGGSNWAPAMKGLNGSTDSGININGSTITVTDTDHNSSISTDDYATCHAGSSAGGGGGGNSVTVSSGTFAGTYTITPGATSTFKIVQGGTTKQIADFFFQGAVVTGLYGTMNVHGATGYIFVSRGAGGVIVGVPNAGPPALSMGTLSTPVVTSNSVASSWTAASGGATPYTYKISTDGGTTFKAISGPGLTDTRTLLNGTYHFVVRVTDNNSATADSSTISVIVDGDPQINSSANWPVASVATTWTNAAGGVSPYTYAISYNSGAYATPSGPGNLDTHTFSNGSQTARVRVTDSAGTQAFSDIFNFSVAALTAPAVTSPTAGQSLRLASNVIAFSAATGGTTPYTYTASYDGGAFNAINPVVGNATSDQHTFTTNGSHSVAIRVTDHAGTVLTSSTITFSVAFLTAPTVTSPTLNQIFTSSPEGMAWGLAAGGTSPYTYKVRYHTTDAFSTPSATNADSVNLANRSYSFAVQVTDQAGTQVQTTNTPFSVNVVVLSPSTSITTINGINVGPNMLFTVASLTTAWSAASGGVGPYTYTISYDNGVTFKTPSATSTDTTTFTDGSYNAQIKVTDSGARTGLSTVVPFTVLTTPPPVPVIDTAPTAASGGSTSNPNATFSFHEPSWPNAVQLSAALGAGAFSNVIGTVTYGPLAAATYTFHIRATDTVSGLVSANTDWVWTVTASPAPDPPVITSAPSKGGTSTPQTITVTNNGTANLIMGTLTISGTNASQFAIITDSLSSQTLAPAASKTAILEFLPTVLGVQSATLNMPNNADTNHTISLSGTGIQTGTTQVTASPLSINFGQIIYGQSSLPVSVSFQNTGTLPVTMGVASLNPITALVDTGFETNNVLDGGWTDESVTGALSLVTSPIAHGSQSLKVDSSGPMDDVLRYNLTPTPGIQNVAFRFYAQFSALPIANTILVECSGSGSGAPTSEIFLTPTGHLNASVIGGTGGIGTSTLATNTWYLIDGQLDYSTTTAKCQVNISNFSGTLIESLTSTNTIVAQGFGYFTLGRFTGNLIWYIDDFRLQAGGFPIGPYSSVFTLQNDLISNLTLNPLQSGTIKVLYTPGSVNDVAANDLLLSYSSSSGSGSLDIPLSGQGKSATPVAHLSATTLTFPDTNIGAHASLSVSVTNTGTANLVCGTATLTGTNAADFSITADTVSGQTIAPAGSGSFTVQFAPSAISARVASLNILDNAADSPQRVALGGNGLAGAPVVSLSPTSISFPNRVIHTISSIHTVTITNAGTANLVIGTLSIAGTNPAQFGIRSDNASGHTVTPDSNVTVGVVFSPTRVGSFSANLLIPDNAGGSPQALPLGGVGTVGAVQPYAQTVYSYYYPSYGLSSAEGFNTESYEGWGGTYPAPLGSAVTHTFVPPTSIASDYYPGDYWTGAAGSPPKIYSSSDPAVLQAQCVAAINAGINVLVVSWSPPPDRSDTLISPLLTACQAATNATGLPLFLSFMIEPWATANFTDPVNSTVVNTGRSAAGLWHAVNYLNNTYRSHPNFYKTARTGWHYASNPSGVNIFFLNHPEYDYLVAGTPHVSIAGSGTFWKAGTDAIHNVANVPAGGLILVESAFTAANCNTQDFDGGFVYLILPNTQSGVQNVDVFQWNRTYELGFPPTAICIPSAAPGYSAWRAQSALNRRHPRNNGAFYDTQWYQAANGVALADIAVTSWNDWQHGTQIENATPTGGTGQ